MFNPTLLIALVSAACVSAVPHMEKRAAPVSDVGIFQFALTLEHLENAFYTGALAKYDAQAFEDAGFPAWVRGRFQQISDHEASHVEFLETVLGAAAPQPCEYNFPYTDPATFADLAMILEGVGTAAYLGAAQFVQNKDYLTAAGSILAEEARHEAWISSAVEKGAAWDTAYQTPLSVDGVFSLAVGFIKSCPSTNPELIATPLPALTLAPAGPSTFSTQFDNKKNVATTYLAYFTGLDVLYSPIVNGKTTAPAGLMGTVYVAAVSNNSGKPTADTTLSGLAILEYPFKSDVRQNQ